MAKSKRKLLGVLRDWSGPIGAITGVISLAASGVAVYQVHSAAQLSKQIETHQLLYEALVLLGAKATKVNVAITRSNGNLVDMQKTRANAVRIQAIISRIVALEGESKRARELEVMLAMGMGDVEWLSEELRVNLQRQGNFSPASLNAGTAMLYSELLHDYRKAEELFAEAFSQGPNERVVIASYAQFSIVVGNSERALTLIDRLEKLSPDDLTLLAWKGNALVRMNRAEEAIVALSLHANDKRAPPQLFNQLAQAYAVTGKNGEAAKAVRKAIELDGNRSLYRVNLAILLKRDGLVDDAEKEIEIARRIATPGDRLELQQELSTDFY